MLVRGPTAEHGRKFKEIYEQLRRKGSQAAKLERQKSDLDTEFQFPSQAEFLKFPKDMTVTSIGFGYSNISLAFRDKKLDLEVYKLDQDRELNTIFQSVSD